MDSKRELAAFLGVLTGPENDYFSRSFMALRLPPMDPSAIERGPVTERFDALIRKVIAAGDYGRILSVLVAAEWTYLAWASEARDAPRPARFYLAEWIELHATPEFARFVGWLRSELDRAGASADESARIAMSESFRETMALEVGFFAQAFDLAKS